MPHADSSLVPESIETKVDFWNHVHEQLENLLDGQHDWVTNLSNASSLIFNSLLAFPRHFGPSTDSAVNWCGFYIHSKFFPTPSLVNKQGNADSKRATQLLLGPFCGKPACQIINVAQGKARGVCADAYTSRTTLLIPDVESYPGHIACDGETKSEIVCPLLLEVDGEIQAVGVLDLDCLKLNGFDEDDKAGLERIAGLVVKACNW